MGVRWTGDKELQAVFRKMHDGADQACARALSGLAFDARKEIQGELPKWLKLTRPFLQQSVVYVPARASKLEAWIGFLPRANWVKLLEHGGTRLPKGSAIAIPTDNVRRTGKGGVSNANRPSAVLARPGAFSGVPEGGNRAAGIWQATKRLGLRALYIYKKSTTYDANQIHFFDTVEKSVRNNFERKMRESIEHLVRKSK